MSEEAPSPLLPLEGGCLCGRLRYRITVTASAYWCHCALCRKASGSAALPWVSVPRAAFAFTAGEPAHFASSPGVTRSFCAACGSPILFAKEGESEVDVTVGTLDTPDAVVPSHHIWTRSALRMTEDLGAGLPRHREEVPDEVDGTSGRNTSGGQGP